MDTLELTEKYLEFIENLNEGIWIIDADANTTFVNPRMAKMLGYTPNEMIGKHLFYFLDESLVESAKNNLKRRAQGIRESLEFEFKHKSGNKVKTSVHTFPLMQNDGKYNGALAAITDITEKKDLSKIVHELEIKFKSIFDYASIGLAILNKELQILDANEEFCEKLKYKKDEIFNISLLSIILPENKSELINNINKLIDGTSNAFLAEYKLISKNGSTIWGVINYFAVKEGQNKEITIVVSLRDITEKKNTEFELFKREALFKGVLENSTLAITIWDKELRNIYANQIALDLAGRKRDYSRPNKHLFDDMPSEIAGLYEKWEKRVLECFNTERTHQYTDVDHIGGKYISSESFTNPIRDSDGNVFAVAIIFNNVSERKQLELELLRKEKFAALGIMSAHLSHEIRSPLASISMNMEFLNKNLNLDDRQAKSFTLIKGEIERLNNLLNEVLGFSKEIHLNKMDFDISKTLENISELFKVKFKEKNIIFINSVSPQVLHGDAEKIEAAIIDVIKNSLEAIDKIGTIEIYSRRKSTENIFELFIKDTGCGVENITKLFDPFYTTKTRGTGLGLSIVKIIIEKHGGTINLLSSISGETIFQINLPINEKNSL